MKVSRRNFLGTCAGGAVTGIIGAPYLIAQEINPGVLPTPSTGKEGSFRSALQLRKNDGNAGK